MKQREVQDADGTRWTCVQALSGGGAETERLTLAVGWERALSDDELLAAIAAARAR